MEKQLNNTTTSLNDSISSGKIELFNREGIVYLVFCCMLSLTIVVGNIFVIIAFKLNYKLRTVTNLGLVSLAFSDFLVGLISIPLWIYFDASFNESERSAYMLGLVALFDIFNGSASIFQLTAISMERCFSVVAPLRHRTMSNSSHYRTVFLVWILAITCSLTYVFPYTGLINVKWYTICNTLVCFVIPWAIMTGSYYLLFRCVKKRNLNSPASNQPFNWASQRKIIITLLIVSGLFTIAWSPFFIVNLLHHYWPPWHQHHVHNVHVRRFPKLMQYINSGINPFVYSYRNKDFRSTFKRIIFSVVRCQPFQQVYKDNMVNNSLKLKFLSISNVSS